MHQDMPQSDTPCGFFRREYHFFVENFFDAAHSFAKFVQQIIAKWQTFLSREM